MWENDEPPDDGEQQPRQEEVHGEDEERPPPLGVHQRREYVLEVFSPPLRHVRHLDVAVAMFEDNPLSYPPRVESRLSISKVMKKRSTINY